MTLDPECEILYQFYTHSWSSAVEMSKFVWIGRRYSLPLPRTVFKILGDWVTFPVTIAKSLELGKQRNISKPPPSFSLGYVPRMISLNSFIVQLTFGTVTVCSPSPAPSSKIFVEAEQGTFTSVVSLRQKILTVQGWTQSLPFAFALWIRTKVLSLFSSLWTCIIGAGRLTDLKASTARLHVVLGWPVISPLPAACINKI